MRSLLSRSVLPHAKAHASRVVGLAEVGFHGGYTRVLQFWMREVTQWVLLGRCLNVT